MMVMTSPASSRSEPSCQAITAFGPQRKAIFPPKYPDSSCTRVKISSWKRYGMKIAYASQAESSTRKDGSFS